MYLNGALGLEMRQLFEVKTKSEGRKRGGTMRHPRQCMLDPANKLPLAFQLDFATGKGARSREGFPFAENGFFVLKTCYIAERIIHCSRVFSCLKS